MKTLLWLLQFSSIIATTFADPKGFRPRQAGTYAITGILVTADDGSVPFRQEIRQLQSNADQWNLYLLALDRLQTADQNDVLSHYSISGIHGRPYVPWDGVQATPGDENSGYCTHSSVLFPTWHRPYLALYEQVLYNTIQTIVEEFSSDTDRSRYAAVASTFRIPYWDWAATPPDGDSALPDSVTTPTVIVDTPNGTMTIDNPLYAYKFQPNSDELAPTSTELNSGEPNWPIWKTTLRYPTDESTSAVSQNNVVASKLTSNNPSLHDRLYLLFTTDSNYTIFSNQAWSQTDDNNSYDSLEAVHGVIHVQTGGPRGHMSYPQVAGFDPIFYLHHAAVDRAFAIWQALYPDSYVQPEPSQLGTFTTNPGDIEDVDTGLTPFHTDSTGDFWTSVSARSTGTFGYSYPELPFWTEDSDPAAYQASLRSKINELYGSPANTVPMKRELNTTSDQYREWIANIRAQKFALAGSFSVYIFVGDFNPDPARWSFDPNLVGTHCFFAESSDCQNCVNSGALHVSGAVPLTAALLATIQNDHLKSLEPGDVESYLRENLHWRVALLDDTTVQPDQVPGLFVSVASAIVTKANSVTEFPTWGAFSVHTSITDSRPGGLPAGGYS